MKHQEKFNAYLNEKYKPIKVYDRLFPFSEVLEVKNPVLYLEMFYKFVLNLAVASSDDEHTPPNTPVTSRPRGL